MNPPDKNFLKSKTFWTNVIAAGTMLYPPVGAVINTIPGGSVGILAGLNILLRFISSGKVTLT
jgi:hypothetical protein